MFPKKFRRMRRLKNRKIKRSRNVICAQELRAHISSGFLGLETGLWVSWRLKTYRGRPWSSISPCSFSGHHCYSCAMRKTEPEDTLSAGQARCRIHKKNLSCAHMLGQADNITECHRLGDLHKNLFLMVLDTRNPRSRCQQGWSLVSAVSVFAVGLTILHASGGTGGREERERRNLQCL